MLTATELSIVVPTFNEAGNVTPLLGLLETALCGIAYEVIFVDDDSPDGTAERVRQISQTDPRIRLLRRVGRTGLSSACLEGMMAAKSPYIAVMDADLQHDEKILPAMLKLAREQNLDVVVGSRHTEGGGMGDFAAERVALSNWGSRLSRAIARCSVSDPMSGFFLVDRRFLDEVIYRVSGIGFKILLDLLASSPRAVRLGEVPYTFRTRQFGESKLDILVLVEYLQLLVDKLTGGLLPVRFLLFSVVGLVGVCVNFLGLTALQAGLHFDFTSSYLPATLLAMTSNFFLNNVITYRDCRIRGMWPVLKGWLSFCVACSLGAIVSLVVIEAMRRGGMGWTLAILIGISLASIWNYAMTQLLTWQLLRRSRRHKENHQRLSLRPLSQTPAGKLLD